MIKKIFALLLITQLYACAELQSALGTILEESGELTESQIAAGLKEALNSGISKGAATLSQTDGYYKSGYKILLPPEARKVTDKLKNVPGFTNVEEIILEKINRGAEDAAKKAKPIFVAAIKNMTFKDVMNILMGEDDAATRYLQGATTSKLYREFNPVIVESLDKFNARQYWADAVGAYNKLPFVQTIDDDLDDYVTNQALNGLFSMVEKEEKNIRNNIAARTTDLLKRVFAKQDNK
jgi:hypothetical protein